MPIHIKELLVRTIIEQKPETAGSSNGQSNPPAINIEELIARCVEQVIKQLNYQQEQ